MKIEEIKKRIKELIDKIDDENKLIKIYTVIRNL